MCGLRTRIPRRNSRARRIRVKGGVAGQSVSSSPRSNHPRLRRHSKVVSDQARSNRHFRRSPTGMIGLHNNGRAVMDSRVKWRRRRCAATL